MEWFSENWGNLLVGAVLLAIIVAIIVDMAALYMLFRPYKEATKLTTVD